MLMPSTPKIYPADPTTDSAVRRAAYELPAVARTTHSPKDASLSTSCLDDILKNEHHPLHADDAWLLREMEAADAAAGLGGAARAALRAILGGSDGETVGRLVRLQEATTELARGGGQGPGSGHITAWPARGAICGACRGAPAGAAPSARPAEAV